ncbi:c-type cytochrome [Bradyrhizobium jicamae]|uniref:C-type cytochrome n=1 Tax=Bradyrhizobium jicamae TaxID=280332 RepID=A0ABS5FPQ7_9BRAD|nr:c-type cytochrome [Bradyrhizobium jicamae]MBR0798749.1 c-type cytochrome [Bradyrhizobium jicamae]
MTILTIVRKVTLWRAGTLVVATAATLIAVTSANAAGDAARGATLYRDCGVCHSIQENGPGPAHKGVFGRLAGKAPGYDYSSELKNSNIVWTEENLDKWLAGPEKLVPGTKMFYEVDDPRDRADIIAFLKEKAK